MYKLDLSVVYRRFASPLRSLAFAIVHDAEGAEDTVQDAFLAILIEPGHQGWSVERARAWLAGWVTRDARRRLEMDIEAMPETERSPVVSERKSAA